MARLAEFGLMTALIEPEMGGLGLGWFTHILLAEEVFYTSADLGVPVVINAIAAVAMARLAPPHLRERYLRDMLAGRLIGCFGVSEPGVGSDASGVQTRARRQGQDWIISGEKTWISNGGHSDFFICTCKTEDGLTHILIDREEHGYVTRDIDKMALNGHSTAQVFLDEVRVPASNVIGDPGRALKQTLLLFEQARPHVAAWSIGLARRALHEAITYACERRQHGKPIAGHQLIAEKIASMATHIDAARLLMHRVASMLDAGVRCDVEASMAKWYATEMAVKATRDALQIHGGNGVTKAFLVERLTREALIAPIPDGTTEIQKLIISRGLTGVSAFA
jgi:alkylation response protein AidB-like acyl-CoA dehydrogenase